ncbi:MAG: hypothetical protein IKS15_06000 [Opitutales bacterium]|nr:hypothetical protein [Opitutales bacterium]
MGRIFLTCLFLAFAQAFSAEYAEIKNKGEKIYTASVDCMPKAAIREIENFAKSQNLASGLDSDFILKRSFLRKELKCGSVYITSLKGLDICTLFDAKLDKAYVLNGNSNNQKLSLLICETLGGGLAEMIKSGNLESFYKLVFELTYGANAETGAFFEVWIKDIDEKSSEGRTIRLKSIKKDGLLKVWFPSEFKIIGSAQKWECRFCAATRDGEVFECIAGGGFDASGKLNILSVSRKPLLEAGKFELLYVP